MRHAIEALLGVSERPDDDYNFFRDRWMKGTCDWILQEPILLKWLNGSNESRVLWLHALPASGKSIMASPSICHLNAFPAP